MIKQPATHAKAHPTWGHRWDEYAARQYIGHRLHKQYFEMLMGCDGEGRALHSVDYEGSGCLDAPEVLPAGSTLCVRTIGGWEREEYNTIWRGQEDWRERERAEIATAKMLKKILEETE